MLSNTTLLYNLNSLEEIKNKALLFFYLTGPYGPISIILPIIIFLGLVFSFIYRRMIKKTFVDRRDFAICAILGAGLLIYFYLYLKAPYTFKDFLQNVRYAMPFLILGVIASAYMVEKLIFARATFYLFTIMVFAFSFIFLIIRPPESVPLVDRFFVDQLVLVENITMVIVFAIAMMALFWAFQVGFSKIKNKNLKICVAGFLVITSLSGTYLFFDFAHKEREFLTKYWTPFYYEEGSPLLDIVKAAEWLDKNAPDGNIAYSGFNFHYHLYGRDFNRDVNYININECADCRYVDYKCSEESIRRDPDHGNWIKNLEEYKKEYLVVNPYTTPGVRNYEIEWARENSNNFEQVFNINNVYIYQISYDKKT